jgi:hypothetical protein
MYTSVFDRQLDGKIMMSLIKMQFSAAEIYTYTAEDRFTGERL